MFSLSKEQKISTAEKEKEIQIKHLMPGNHACLCGHKAAVGRLQPPSNLICLWVVCKCNFYLFLGQFSKEINGYSP